MQRYHKGDSPFNSRRKTGDLVHDLAPIWAEATAPRNVLRRRSPALLIVELPDGEGEHWQMATLEQTNAVANPASNLGRLIRPYCALLSLPYISDN